MIVYVQIQRSRTESWVGHFQVNSIDDILLKGSVFKKYDMTAEYNVGYFTMQFKHATNEYPKLLISNQVTWLSTQEHENLIVLEAGTPLLEAVAQKMIGEGNG